MKVNIRKVAIDYLGLIIAIITLIAIFSLLTRYFFSKTTFLTIANQIPSAVLIATGMTYILIIAEIDLSVGSVLGFSGAVLGVAIVNLKLPPFAAISLAILAGVLCGFINGAISLRWRLPSFIVTLGMFEMARGGAHALTGSQTQYLGDKLDFVAGTSLFGLSLPFIIAFAIMALAQFVLSKTVFGRYMIAIGTNEEAARLSGIDPKPIKLAVFALCGFLVSLAAIIDTSRFNSANPNAGTGFELQAIAAAVIGGTSLMGGRGSVISSFLGVLIIAVLNSGLAALGLRDEIKRLITGAVIIAAVIVDYYRIKFKTAKK
ncbi:MAG: ABC transporter permease [Verrucomicrobiia bacterium]